MIIWIFFFTFQSFPPCKNSRGSFCVWGYLFSCFPTPNCWMLSPLQSWGRWVRSGGPPVPLILDRPPQYWNSPHGPLPPPTPTHPHPLFPRYFAFPPNKADVAKSASSGYNKIHIFSKLHALSKIHSNDKVSWQIWLLAYIPRGLASRSWGCVIQNPPETHYMAQFFAGFEVEHFWYFVYSDIAPVQQGSCVTHENYQSIQLITQHLPVDQEKVDTI